MTGSIISYGRQNDKGTAAQMHVAYQEQGHQTGTSCPQGSFCRRLYTVPKSNTRFWQEKVKKNKRRDAAVTLRLEARGWNVITVWECGLDSAHRHDTIASLVLQIRENGRKAGLESAERRERLEAARKEAADRRVRRSDLEEEISKIYDIPARIRRASVADGDPIPYGQDDYDSDRN